jgi:hypothetical protein
MKKIVIIFIAATAFFSFSCNKYCSCKRYIDGKLDKNYKQGDFVKESDKSCESYGHTIVEDGVIYEVKCK